MIAKATRRLHSWSVVLSTVALLSGTSTVHSQPCDGSKGKLFRVNEGIFELIEGKVIDLTDRKILLSMPLEQYHPAIQERKEIKIKINGNWNKTVKVGERIDILGGAHTYGFKDSVRNLRKCLLDVIDVLDPKGAPVQATFRLDCN